MAEDINDLKKLIGTKRLIFGTDRTVKELKKGNLEKVYLSSNCNSNVKEDINHYGRLSKTIIVSLEMPNDELRIVVKKPFSVSVIGVTKA
jgi:ribosomal protein L30E